MPKTLVAVSIFLAALAATTRPAAAAEQGKELVEKRCGGCHALDSAREGPPLRGVFGRRAGSVSNFPYSDGVRAAGLIWDAANLDKWLADPESLIPRTDMAFRLSSAAERTAIIAYLKSLSEEGHRSAGRP